MPQCDPSQTYTRAVWPEPSPADLQRFPAGVSEVSRFSCMKFLGVSGVFDYAGPTRARAIALVRVASANAAEGGLGGMRFEHLHAVQNRGDYVLVPDYRID